jgi:hypothetical protein
MQLIPNQSNSRDTSPFSVPCIVPKVFVFTRIKAWFKFPVVGARHDETGGLFQTQLLPSFLEASVFEDEPEGKSHLALKE